MTIWRLPVTLTLAGMPDEAVNVFHLRTVGDPGDTQSAADALHDFYEALAGLSSGSVQCLANGVHINAEGVTSVDGSSMDGFTWDEIVVPESGAIMPHSAAVVVNWLTSVPARRGRGRSFIGPLTAGALQADGTVTDAQLGSLQDAAAALVSASLSDNLWAFGVYGLESAGGTPTSPHVLRDFQSSRVLDRFGWLRSRSR